MANRQEQIAMKFVRNWTENRRITVEEKSGKGVGYDYRFIYPSGRIENIEGTEKKLCIGDVECLKARK
jgi:hypothetical protein